MTDAAERLTGLEVRLGHRFSEPALLKQALTHASGPADRLQSNERLEFLGDRVLGLCVARLIYAAFPGASEGDLGYRFTGLVRREALAEVAARLDLGAHLDLAPSEEEAGGRENPALMADACEAVIGALFLDGGLDAARTFIEAQWRPLLDRPQDSLKDAKTRLQEWAQANGVALPAYRILARTGPDHAPEFSIEAAVLCPERGEITAEGQGKSKQTAQQAAAAEVLARISGNAGDG